MSKAEQVLSLFEQELSSNKALAKEIGLTQALDGGGRHFKFGRTFMGTGGVSGDPQDPNHWFIGTFVVDKDATMKGPGRKALNAEIKEKAKKHDFMVTTFGPITSKNIGQITQGKNPFPRQGNSKEILSTGQGYYVQFKSKFMVKDD